MCAVVKQHVTVSAAFTFTLSFFSSKRKKVIPMLESSLLKGRDSGKALLNKQVKSVAL